MFAVGSLMPCRLRVLCASAVISGEHRSDRRAWLSGPTTKVGPERRASEIACSR